MASAVAATGMLEMDATKLDTGYRVAEYTALRAEILAHIDAIRAMEMEVVIGIAAVYAWGLTHSWPSAWYFRIALFLVPSVLVFINLIRVRDRQQRINRLADYIRAMESHLDTIEIDEFKSKGIQCKGWETYVAYVREKTRQPSERKLVWTAFKESRYDLPELYHQKFWPMLLWGTLIIGVLLTLLPI